MRYAIYAIAILLGAIVVGGLVVDEGEVVTLTTRGDGGSLYETQLWVVDSEGSVFVRASSEHSDWLGRLRANPSVELRRGEQSRAYLARPDDGPELRARINRAMAEKYGFSDRLVALVADPERAVPVRLEPAPESAPPESAPSE